MYFSPRVAGLVMCASFIDELLRCHLLCVSRFQQFVYQLPVEDSGSMHRIVLSQDV